MVLSIVQNYLTKERHWLVVNFISSAPDRRVSWL
ncbi:hypothetical protein N7462_010880 [Penicillium macrosclerotiorum]|nr:uncharacterized protein N7462_010880 [Penicillium macrosclerotiorum]KAJ5669810.1 hypothetical protein N7462_010880 [Penicillium macrosclerotiorum]